MQTVEQRLLMGILIMLFGILLALNGGGQIGIIVGVVAFIVALVQPSRRS